MKHEYHVFLHTARPCTSLFVTEMCYTVFMDLGNKKCKACEGGTPPLSEREVGEYMKELSEEWRILDGKKLIKEFLFKDFVHAMSFVDMVADVAESEGHHPDIHIHYNKVQIELMTHAIGGLSENDFIVAAKIEQIKKVPGSGTVG